MVINAAVVRLMRGGGRGVRHQTIASRPFIELEDIIDEWEFPRGGMRICISGEFNHLRASARPS